MIKVTALSGDEREPSRSEIVRDRLAAIPFAAEPHRRVILTGGTCQLTLLPEVADRFGPNVGISGLSEAAKGPAFAAARSKPCTNWPRPGRYSAV
jgi:cell division ATPase FtsA